MACSLFKDRLRSASKEMGTGAADCRRLRRGCRRCHVVPFAGKHHVKLSFYVGLLG